jgi:hypothetical protein
MSSSQYCIFRSIILNAYQNREDFAMRRCSVTPLARFAGLFGLVALLLVAGSQQSLAQSASKNVAPDSAKALIGTWEGKYDSDHAGPGGMKITIEKDSVLKATSLYIAIGGDMQSVPVHDFAVTTNDISWIQEAMGMACQATAVVKSGQMKGAVMCGHGQITFTLTKRS